MKRIAIFASGEGTNTQKIIDYFKANRKADVAIIISNRPQAFVLERAKKSDIPTFIVNKTEFYQNNQISELLKEKNIDLIVLAGFLWQIPESLIKNFHGKIINIHPALLPKFGGKGMYGYHVHRAVIDAGEKESGITIHYVNERYDEGEVIFQAKCPVEKNDTPETLAQKIHLLEHEFYPEIIERVLLGNTYNK